MKPRPPDCQEALFQLRLFQYYDREESGHLDKEELCDLGFPRMHSKKNWDASDESGFLALAEWFGVKSPGVSLVRLSVLTG